MFVIRPKRKPKKIGGDEYLEIPDSIGKFYKRVFVGSPQIKFVISMISTYQLIKFVRQHDFIYPGKKDSHIIGFHFENTMDALEYSKEYVDY